MKTKSKASLTGLTIIIGIFCLLCAPACAQYNYDGFHLETIKNGTVKGDVYISCGDNAGLAPLANPTIPRTFVTNFTNVPSGNAIKWAELKIGVWGGTRTYKGWVNTTLSSASSNIVLGNETLNWTATPFPPNIHECGNGVWLVCYNLTAPNSNLSSLNSSSIKATVNTNQIDPGFDGRVYGAVLIVVYEDGNCYTQFWINQGLENLHKNYTVGGTFYPHKDANITWFNGTAEEGCSSLTVGYLAGDYGQKDYLHFNPPYNNTPPYVSPYNNGFSNAGWNISHYSTYQLNGNDVANENSDTSNYFDLHTFCITGLVNNTGDNYAIFWRGHANGNDSYITDPPWPGVNPETEAYYSPFLAVLKTRLSTFDFSNNTSGVAGVDHFAYKYQVGLRTPNSNSVPRTEFTPAEYNKIKADDGTFQSSVTTRSGKYAAQRFVFNTSCCNTSNFDAINVTWNGKGWHEAGGNSNGAYLYIWNFNTKAYEELANCSDDGTENTLTGEKTANLNNYINNSQVIVLAEQKAADDGDDHSHIETDYVKLFLRPNA